MVRGPHAQEQLHAVHGQERSQGYQQQGRAGEMSDEIMGYIGIFTPEERELMLYALCQYEMQLKNLGLNTDRVSKLYGEIHALEKGEVE